MTESMPPTFEQFQQLNRGLTEKVLDKAASDPQWKQQLIDDPEAAVRGANFPETQQLEQWHASAAQQGDEVGGQSGSWGGPGGGGPWGGWCPWQCGWWTYYWYRSWGGGW